MQKYVLHNIIARAMPACIACTDAHIMYYTYLYVCVIASEASFLYSLFNGSDFYYNYIFQNVRRSVSVLNVSTCI